MANAIFLRTWLTGSLTDCTILNSTAQPHVLSGRDQVRCKYSFATCSGGGDTQENPSGTRRCQPYPATVLSGAAIKLCASERPGRYVAFCAASTSNAEMGANESTTDGNVKANTDVSRKSRLVRSGALEGGKRAARKGGLPTPKEVWSRSGGGAKVTRNFAVLRVPEEGNAELDSGDQVDPTADGSRDKRQPVAGRHGTAGGADVARDADVASSTARDAFMRLLHSVRIAESDADLDRVLDTCPAAIGRMELNGILAKVEDEKKVERVFQWMCVRGWTRNNPDAFFTYLKKKGPQFRKDEAEAFFDQSQRDTCLPSLVFPLISSFAKRGDVLSAVDLFHRTIKMGVLCEMRVVRCLFVALLQSAKALKGEEKRRKREREKDGGKEGGKEKWLELAGLGEGILEEVEKEKLKSPLPYNVLMHLYLGGGEAQQALSVLSRLDASCSWRDEMTAQNALHACALGGRMEEAEELMKELGDRPATRLHPYLHTVMITGLGMHGHADRAVEVLRTFQERGGQCDMGMYSALIIAVARKEGGEGGEQAETLLAEAKAAGLTPTSATYLALITMYGKTGRLKEVAKVLAECLQSGISDPPLHEAAFTSCVLNPSLPPLHAEEVMGEVEGQHWVPSPLHLRRAAEAYSWQTERPSFVWRWFEHFSSHKVPLDAATWSSLIAHHLARGDKKSASELLQAMHRAGVGVQNKGLPLLTYNFLLNTCAESGQMATAEQVLSAMLAADVAPSIATWTTLLKGYGKVGGEEEVVGVYRRMRENGCQLDQVAYCTLLLACGKVLPVDEVAELALEMKGRGVRARGKAANLQLALMAQGGLMEEAEEMFQDMKAHSDADAVSFSTLIAAYGKARRFEKMEQVAQDATRVGISLELPAYNAMIDAYGKAGLYLNMENGLARLREAGYTADVFTFNSMVHAYGMGNMVKCMEDVVERQRKKGLPLDAWTYNILIGAYGDLGMPYASVKIFREMQDAGLTPDEITYKQLVRAFRRAGEYLEAARWSLWMKQAGFSRSEMDEEEGWEGEVRGGMRRVDGGRTLINQH